MFKAVDKWFVGYLRSVMRRPKRVEGIRHLIVCFANHFEPFRGGADRHTAHERVKIWVERLEKSVERATDGDGRPPVQTFFYPAEEYDEEILDMIAGLFAKGMCEVEVHLHHRNDTKENLTCTLEEYRDILSLRHGLLGRDSSGRARFGFVHGNWALCNSRPDGDWCGVNEELSVLINAGCYADFTFPSAPSPTQPRMVNVIYRAEDRPGMPRGHDRGRIVRKGTGIDSRPGLMVVPGPLSLDWQRRKWGVLPRIDNAGIEPANPLTAIRVRRAVSVGIHVYGTPSWIFAKFHLHGCVEAVAREFLINSGPETLAGICASFNDSLSWKLHWVSAREMYNIIRAAENGCEGDAGLYRDYEIERPASRGA